MARPPFSDDDFVTRSDCSEIMDMVTHKMDEVIQSVNGLKTEVKDFKHVTEGVQEELMHQHETLYGIERAGKIEGGVVNILQDVCVRVGLTQRGAQYLVRYILTPAVAAAVTAYLLGWLHF